MRIKCPFCLEFHDESVAKCPNASELYKIPSAPIPKVYINDFKRGIPVIPIITIGYRGHTKTCFLSGLIYTLYYGRIGDIWPGFSFIALNNDTLKEITNTYITPLARGELPPASPVVLSNPLILKFQKTPIKKGFIVRKIKQGDIIFIFYDIGGEAFDVDALIKEKLPILEKINTLIFLINLPKIIGSFGVTMHRLVNTISLALGETKERNTLLCFTRADVMWSNPKIYGPLAQRLDLNIPSIPELPIYFKILEDYSHRIGEYIYGLDSNIYNLLANNVKSFKMIPIAPLGSEPKSGKITRLSPYNIFGPILLALKFEKYL